MFKKGQYIIYGNIGVCQVTDIGDPPFSFDVKGKQYYTLIPVYSKETIYTPVDTTVFMREVITKEEAAELIDKIPDIKENIYTGQKLNQLSEHYKAYFESHSCEDLVELIKSVYAKNEEFAEIGKKIGNTEQQFMKRAEQLLHGELAVALDIDFEYVPKYIEKKLQTQQV